MLGATTASQAQRFAIVDVTKVLETMTEYQNAQAELDKLAAEWRQDIARQYDDIRALYNRYQAEQVLLSDDARKQREDEIMNKEKAVRDAQKEKFGPEGQLFIRRQALVRPIQDKVYAAIQAYAADRGYDIILDKSSNSGIIFSNPEFDKTEDVLKRIR